MECRFARRWQRRHESEKSAFRGVSPASAAASNPPYRVRQSCDHFRKMGLLQLFECRVIKIINCCHGWCGRSRPLPGPQGGSRHETQAQQFPRSRRRGRRLGQVGAARNVWPPVRYAGGWFDVSKNIASNRATVAERGRFAHPATLGTQRSPWHSVYNKYDCGIDSRAIIGRLQREGWRLVRTKGSHRQYKHPTMPGLVTVPHPKRDIPQGTLRSIFKQARWENEP